MIERVTASNQFIYHYTKGTTALDHILKNRTFRFGKYNNTNDPKETKNWEFDLGTNEHRNLGKYNTRELSKWLSAELKCKTKLACFSMDSGPLTGNHIEDIFKRGFCKPRMWAQYAENHTGVCLVFDHQKLSKLINSAFAASNFIISKPVNYINRKVIRKLDDPDDQQYVINVDYLEAIGQKGYAEAHLKTHYKRLFFEKMTDWKDEAEWRDVIFTTTEEDLYLDIKDSLAGIIFGENTQEIMIQNIMEQTETWNLRYMGLKWKNCSPWYDYANPRYIPGIKGSPWEALIKKV